MAHLMLYGNGWTQRWQIAEGEEEHALSEVTRVGREGTGRIQVLDAGTAETATLVVAWSQIAVAVVLDAHQGAGNVEATGQYA